MQGVLCNGNPDLAVPPSHLHGGPVELMTGWWFVVQLGTAMAGGWLLAGALCCNLCKLAHSASMHAATAVPVLLQHAVETACPVLVVVLSLCGCHVRLQCEGLCAAAAIV
jgi:hypothetical protein